MKESFDKITANAKAASETLASLKGQLKHPEKLWTYFHLRPTTAGINIISTLGYAPMRAIMCTPDELSGAIQALDDKADWLTADNPDIAKALDDLAELGMQSSVSAGGPALDDVQAAFITEMNESQNAYGNLKFVASELALPKLSDEKGSYRFDVVAYDDGCVYFIELKSGRSKAAFKQMDEYMTGMVKEENAMKELFGAYPLTAPGTEGIQLGDFKKVQGVVVMPEAENSRLNWQEISTEHNLEVWFYQTALVFRKFLPMNLTGIL